MTETQTANPDELFSFFEAFSESPQQVLGNCLGHEGTSGSKFLTDYGRKTLSWIPTPERP